MNIQNLIPFNPDKAKAGEAVIYRFISVNDDDLVFIHNSIGVCEYHDGKNLFMIPKLVEFYVSFDQMGGPVSFRSFDALTGFRHYNDSDIAFHIKYDPLTDDAEIIKIE